jgi:acyl-[acyl carrier protein]--UDP-N-acetylglucosamine O-acyltransferase
MNSPGIHAMAVVSNKARLGKDVRIGPFTVVHDDVVIGDGCAIDGHCQIGYPTALAQGAPLQLGAGALIRSHCVIYQGSSFGEGFETGHHAVARENTVAGKGLRLGTFSELQNDCVIGDYCRLHSNVIIGSRTRIGNFVWIYPGSGTANDPHPPSNTCLGVTIGDYAVIAVNCAILPGVTLGAHCLIGAQSSVQTDIPPHALASGMPARVHGPVSALRLKDGSDRSAYPWPQRFHRGYPEEVVRRWEQEFGAGEG